MSGGRKGGGEGHHQPLRRTGPGTAGSACLGCLVREKYAALRLSQPQHRNRGTVTSRDRYQLRIWPDGHHSQEAIAIPVTWAPPFPIPPFQTSPQAVVSNYLNSMSGIRCKGSCYWNPISRLFPPHLSQPTSCPSLTLPQATPQTKPVFSSRTGPCTLGPGGRSHTAAELSSPPASISRLGSNTSAAVIRSTTTFLRYLNEVFHCRVPPAPYLQPELRVCFSQRVCFCNSTRNGRS